MKKIYYSASEAGSRLGVPPETLRYWEQELGIRVPLRHGKRAYRPEDLKQLEEVRQLLYEDGMTLKGAQRMLRRRVLRAVLEEATVLLPGVVRAHKGKRLVVTVEVDE